MLDSCRIEQLFDATLEKIAHLTSLASRMAVSAGGFRISAESFRLAVTAAGMVSGFQSLCRQHHNMILEIMANEWYQMKESGFLTVIWCHDGELPFRDLVVFVMCAKRSRKKRRCKPFRSHTARFFNELTEAVLGCLAEIVHAFIWGNVSQFTNKEIPIRSTRKCPAQNE